jgi:hypothetical protein
VIAAPGPGSALAPEVAVALGPGLGADLSPVRVHTDRRAAAATGELGARAFTWGTQVFLGAGERPTDLSVMTHELAHAVQQSAGPAVHLFGGPHGDLEREAHQATAAALRGERFAVRGRTAGPRVQGLLGWAKRGLRAIGRAASAVANAVAELGSWVVDRALSFIKEHARSIPGYDLLAFIIGRDPITQDRVERNAINLLRGLIGLIPGGAALFENLQRARVIQRAGEWFSAEIDKLNLTWEYIRGLFSQAWDALSISDIANPGRAWDKLKAVFGPPLTRIKNFALSAGRKILEFVFEGALALAGGAAQQVLAIFRRIGAVFGLIVSDPVGFFRNLLTAVKGGFDLFRKNILAHLRTALFDWLLGTLRGVLQLPARFDFEGILSIVMQVLGLTYSALRGLLVRVIGEPAVAFIEKAFGFLATVVTKGLTAAWEKIKEFASGLADTVIAAIRDWVARSVVGAAITKLLTLFNPVGALIQAVIGIYNTVMFFIERARQIARLVRSIVDSIESIARGGLSAASQFVERTMANTLPVILAFLGRLIGLGDVTKPIRDIITRIQTAIANAIERVARWIADRVKGLLAGRTAAATAGGEQRAVQLLQSRLAGPRSRPMVEEAVRAVHAEVRLQGVKRLEVGPESSEGEAEIRIEASPLKRLFRLIKGALRRTMRMGVRVMLMGPSPPAQPLGRVQAQEELTSGKAPEPIRYFDRERYRGASVPEVRRGGAVFVPASGETVIRVVTWNTSDTDQKRSANGSHAEHHFVNWFESLPEGERRRVVGIEIHNHPYSPCNACGAELTGLLRELNVLQGRPPNQARPVVASLTWEKPYVKEPNTTYPHTLNTMIAVGWQVTPPTVPVEPDEYEVRR